MTVTVALVRHGSHDRLGKVLCGRMDGVTLSAAGRAEAEALAAALHRGGRVEAILSSPLARARETAAPIGAAFGLPVEIEPALEEIDFGAWSGRSFEALSSDPGWAYWNRERDQARPPGGETMAEAQTRVVRLLDRLRASGGERTVVLVSHADVIKVALAWGLGLPLAFYARFEVSPASVSRMSLATDHVKVWSVNAGAAP